MSEIDLEEVVAIMRATARVGESGDGSATVCVGELRHDGRVAALAGPGWFAGRSPLNLRADSLDFVVRRNDERATRGVYRRNPGSAAQALLAITREGVAAPARETGGIGEILDVDKDPLVIQRDVDSLVDPPQQVFRPEDHARVAALVEGFAHTVRS